MTCGLVAVPISRIAGKNRPFASDSSIRHIDHSGSYILSVSRLPLIFLILITLCSSTATAQLDSATLSGRVYDPAGVGIRGAEVSLIDVDRNIKRTTTTDDTGLYIFPDVAPSQYRMEVSARGFRTVHVTGFTMSTADSVQQSMTMPAVSGTDATPVQIGSSGVQNSATVSTVVDQKLVAELPLNGRSFQTLFQLTPGVVITPATFASQGQFSVNGQRTNTNYFIVDGVSANVSIAAGVNPGQSAGGSLPALTAFGGTNGLVSTDDVQEFGILTSSYSAEFGRMPGAQVSIVTRSGTNEFHGDIFDYVRNDAFDANDWFANRDNLKRAALRQNDYGGVLGGPVSKDKTFFFVSYEGLRLRQPTSRESDVPSLATRNSAPASMKPFFNAYSLPNGPDEGNGLAQATYAFSDPSSLDTGSLRIDHHVNESVTIFGRYDYSTSDRKQRGAAANSLSTVTDTQFVLQTVTAGFSYRLSPRIINDLRANWSVSSASGSDRLDIFGGAIPLSSQSVFPLAFNNENSLFQFLPALGPQDLRLSLGRNIYNIQAQINIVDSTSYQKSSHLFKVGFDFRSLSPELMPAKYTQAAFFADIKSALLGTSLFTNIAGAVSTRSTFENVSAYVQDGWKPYSRLSITYGLRWDYDPAPSGRGTNGLQPFALENTNNLPQLSLAPPGTPIYHATSNNFAPRLGFAYQIQGSEGRETVFKAGVGMFYDQGSGPAGNAFDGTNFPFSAQKILAGATFPLGQTESSAPVISSAPPFSTLVAFPSTLKLPYTLQWNIAFQQSFGNEETLTVSYIGASGHSLLRTEQYLGDVSGVPQAFTQILFTTNSGYSRYDSLQLRFQRRARGGLLLIASYALSHSLDNSSTDATFDSIPARLLSRRSDYGPSDFDVRQTATVGADYSLPLATKSRLARILVSNWVLDPIAMFRSAPPVDVILFRSEGSGMYSFRPDLVPGVTRYLNDPTVPGGRRLNTAAVTVPDAERQGDLGRNSFCGFPLIQTDVAIRRRFRITERSGLQVRVEAFNLFNHPNLSPPVGQFGIVDSRGTFFPQNGFGISPASLGQGLLSSSFNAGFSSLYQIGGARSLQLALKLEF